MTTTTSGNEAATTSEKQIRKVLPGLLDRASVGIPEDPDTDRNSSL